MQKRVVIFLLAMVWILSGCEGGNSSTPTPFVINTPIPPTATVLPTPVPAATRVIISTGNQLSAADVQSIKAAIQPLAVQSGLNVETLPALTPEALSADVKVVVVLPPDPGVSDLAGKFPNIRFVIVAINNVQPSANVFTIGSDGSHPEWLGFTAGYIAAITTNEWRVGALTQAGSNEGTLAGDGFQNGAEFFCGLCNPTYPPFTDYPTAVGMAPASTQAEWQSTVDAFVASGVKTAYIFPGIANPEMMAYLAQGGMKLIGSVPPPDALRPAWIATVKVDYASSIQSIWSDVVSGAAGKNVPAGISVSDMDTNVLTEGKMRLVNEVISNLIAGAISPNTIQ